MNWRDVAAATVGMTPSNGWAWPSTVGGRFRVRLADRQAADGRRLLRAYGLYGLADSLQPDPYSTARALAERYGDKVDHPCRRQEEILGNTATDVRILAKTLLHGNADVVAELIDQLRERLAPFDVGDAAAGPPTEVTGP